MIDIIIPVYNCLDYTVACLNALHQARGQEEIRVWVWDDCSTDETPGFLARIAEPGMGHEYIFSRRAEKQMGFVYSVNRAIEWVLESGGGKEGIVLLNNDVLVSSNWLNRLLSHMKDGVGMVGPCTNQVSGPQQVLLDTYWDESGFQEAAEQFHQTNKGKSSPTGRLVGFCLLISGEVISQIGLLDERFMPGNFEDDDYCFRAIEAGWKLRIARDVYVHHFGHVTHKIAEPAYRQLILRNQKKLFDKWGREKIRELELKGREVAVNG